MAVTISNKNLPPEAQYSAPIDSNTEGAMDGYSYRNYSPPPFDQDKYYDTAYRRIIANADESSFGKMASLGDELLSRHGLGLGSDTWVSAINSLNANRRKERNEAADTALTQTVTLNQQKFNQAMQAGNLNLAQFLQMSADNVRRAGSLQESAKLAEASDAAVRGDYQKLQSSIQSLIDMYLEGIEKEKDRRAGVNTREATNRQQREAAKTQANSGIIRGILSLLSFLIPGGRGGG